MLIVETVAQIWREHFIKGKTIKEIARNTVRPRELKLPKSGPMF